MFMNDKKTLNIKGVILKETDDNCYYFKNEEIELKAYKFTPGRDIMPCVSHIDSCYIIKSDSGFYAVFGNDLRKNIRFCF